MSKYFKLFSTLAAHNAVYNDWSDQSTYNEPWVSFIEEGTGTVTYNRPGVTLSYNAFLDPKNYDPENLLVVCLPTQVPAGDSGNNNSGDNGGISISPGIGIGGGGGIVKPTLVSGYNCSPTYYEDGLEGFYTDPDNIITEFTPYNQLKAIANDNFDIPTEYDDFTNVVVVVENSNILTVDGQFIADMETTEIIITDGDEQILVLRSNGEYEKYWIHYEKV